MKEDLRTRMELIERGTQTFLPILFDGDTTFDNERIRKDKITESTSKKNLKVSSLAIVHIFVFQCFQKTCLEVMAGNLFQLYNTKQKIYIIVHFSIVL